jgi:hypothetical protein
MMVGKLSYSTYCFQMHLKFISMGRLKLACLKIIYKLILVSHPHNKTINHSIHHMCSIFKNVMVTNQSNFGDNVTFF